VDYAVSIAGRFGASLKVIHVYSPPSATEFGAPDMCRESWNRLWIFDPLGRWLI
jgi:hypothetical protein